ncbi:MAG: DUF4186 family protein, partial [Oscillospiraceae bacterium]|nr:DUF4186 family protein [Oscillospiraceae bacterium]
TFCIFGLQLSAFLFYNKHNKGESIDLRGGKDSDFFFSVKPTNEDTVNMVVQYVSRNLPAYYHVNPIRDIQVLTPMQRGVCGASNLNQLLQEALNPSEIYLRRGGIQYRLHDKVMQIRNNYDKEVFNGDIGTVAYVDAVEQELVVDFDGREVTYESSELDELVLSYAITIHKAQGSEFPIVVMPFTMSHYVMLQRNLLYTGVTRAKKVLLLIGEKKAIYYAIRHETTTARNTKLAQRLMNVNSSASRDKFGVNREALFQRLGKSKFRSSFDLSANDRAYISEKGIDTVRSHACDIVEKRLAPASPDNDGKQTPMRGHPVFIAQHATATCCRGCLEKWYNIPKGNPLSSEQQNYIVDTIMEWIRQRLD